MKHALWKTTLGVITLLVSFAFIEQGLAQPGQSDRGRGGFDDERARLALTVDIARDMARSNDLTGRKPLPPGIAKNLARGKPLPPGLRSRQVSGDMLSGLSRYDDYYGDDYEWRIAGEDLLLIELGSLVVTEIFRGVFQ